jgi:hypothetical protein
MMDCIFVQIAENFVVYLLLHLHTFEFYRVQSMQSLRRVDKQLHSSRGEQIILNDVYRPIYRCCTTKAMFVGRMVINWEITEFASGN